MDCRTANIVATILVSGSWTPAAALRRLKEALGKAGSRKRWPARLVEAVFASRSDSVRPGVAEVRAFLMQDIRFAHSAVEILQTWSRDIDQVTLPAERMAPKRAARNWSVPEITTTGTLAGLLGIECSHLDWLADPLGRERQTEQEKLRHYRYKWVRKKSGGQRLIEIPKYRLKCIQRWILLTILRSIPVHKAAHGFVSERSPLSAAAPHVGQFVVMRIDLASFFPSIRAARVAGIFLTAGFPQSVTRMLTGLVTNTTWAGVMDTRPTTEGLPGDQKTHDADIFRPHLPQGSPSSPAVANLVAWSLDCRLTGLARRFGAQYSRYADDLIFSGGRRFAAKLTRFRIAALAIVLNEGFTIRHRKTRVMFAHESQRVAGLVVNRKLSVSRRDYDQLKAILHNCQRYGPTSQNRDDHANFRAHLEGRVAWMAAVRPDRGLRLKQLLAEIDWDVTR